MARQTGVQISMDDLIHEEATPAAVRVEAPPVLQGEKIYTIPDDVWKNRCSICTHRNGKENVPIPLWAIHKQQYAEVVPCRILSVSRPNDRPGECMSFRPKLFEVYGICETCRHDNQFCDGFCDKEDHAEERRVFWGGDFGGDERKVDYWGRHTLSVCDDYEPRFSVKEHLRGMEQADKKDDAAGGNKYPAMAGL